jgi:hypothetical protein
MLLWITQITIISIILIFLVHYLINFFKSTLTVPKIKDLVNSPSQKYENMYNIIKNSSEPNLNPNPNLNLIPNPNLNLIPNLNSNINSDYTLIDLLPKQEEPASMKSELKNFLKKQLQGSSSKAPMDTISSGPAYSSF